MAAVSDELRQEIIVALASLLAEYGGQVPSTSSARANEIVRATTVLARAYSAEARASAVDAVRRGGGDSEAIFKAENAPYLLEVALVHARLAVQPADSRDAGIVMQVAEGLAMRYWILTGRQLHDDLQLWMEGR